MSNGFDGLSSFEDAGTPVVNVETVKETGTVEKAIIEKAKEDLKQMLGDERYVAVRNSRSNDLSVLKTLGYTDSKGLVDKTQEYLEQAVEQGLVKILDKDDETPCEVHVDDNNMPVGCTKYAESGKKKYVVPVNLDSKLDDKGNHKAYRRVVTESQVVGYKIKNESDKPIEYQTELFHAEPDGTFVGTKTVSILKPGETAYISRLYMAKLLVKEEFNMTIRNGILIGKLSKVDSDIETALAAQYFAFNKASGMDVHSPEVKIQIGEQVNVGGVTKYVVKKEFEEVFGYLNNTEAAKVRGRKSTKATGPKPTAQELSALIFREKLGM